MNMSGTHFCEKCGKTMNEKEFYHSKNLEKYPKDGLVNQCKKCMTMFVDNWNPDSFLWILQELDLPYVPDEWQKTMETYAKDGKSPTSMAIMGRYISKMKLKKWKDYSWKDNDFLRDLRNSKIESTMRDQGYDDNEIAKTIAQANYQVPQEVVKPETTAIVAQANIDLISSAGYAAGLAPTIPKPEFVEQDNFGSFDSFGQPSFAEPPEMDLDLTEEDITYLRLKWGKTYRPEEWVKLEQLYKEMMGSYDIQAAGDINTLKLVCKCSLKANQLIDIGD